MHNGKPFQNPFIAIYGRKDKGSQNRPSCH